MRTLLYIPIVHNQADLGTSGSQLSLEGEKKYGAEVWRNHIKQVDDSWKKLELYILERVNKISADKIRIYQDGLPAVGEIGIKIIKDVASKGSVNYSIIDSLITQGSNIELAEDKQLLLEEYNLLSNIINAESPESKLKAYVFFQNKSEELLNSRDNYIANKINLTLDDGETGIAFFGAIHSIVDKLNKDIEVITIQIFNDDISLKLTTK